MADLEPASALASLPTAKEFASHVAAECYHFHELSWFDYAKAEQLIESDRAAVREPLERRIAALELDLKQIRDYLPTDWSNETELGGQAMLTVKAKWDECRQQDDRIASLEAQLASSPPKSPWIRTSERNPPDGEVVVAKDNTGALWLVMHDGEGWNCMERWGWGTEPKLVKWTALPQELPPPAAQKEPHDR